MRPIRAPACGCNQPRLRATERPADCRAFLYFKFGASQIASPRPPLVRAKAGDAVLGPPETILPLARDLSLPVPALSVARFSLVRLMEHLYGDLWSRRMKPHADHGRTHQCKSSPRGHA